MQCNERPMSHSFKPCRRHSGTVALILLIAMTTTAPAAPRFILITGGTAGDVYPFMSLALALQARGHEVSFVTNRAHEHLSALVPLPWTGTGSVAEFEAQLNDPDLWHPRRSLQVMQRGLEAMYRDVQDTPTQVPADEPCVLVVHPLAFAAVSVLRRVRPQARIVVAYLAPSVLRSCDHPMMFGPFLVPHWVPLSWRHWLWRQLDQAIDPVLLPALNALRSQWELPPLPHYLAHLYDDADLSLCLFPDWFAPPQSGWPAPLCMGDFQRFDPHPPTALPDELKQFLAAGPAPVIFTPGSAFRHGEVYFQRALQAVQRLGCRAIFLTGHAEHVPALLPPEVCWQAYVPLRALLPHVALVVHHGGIGTTAEALAAGTPQLVLPLAFDQFDNARRVSVLGAGRVLRAPFWRPEAGVSARALTRELRAMLDSGSLRARCREIAATHLAAPAQNAAVLTALESLLPQTRSSS